jgi:hypothetical protein
MSEKPTAEKRIERGTAGDDWNPAPAVPGTATHAPTTTGTHEQPSTSVPYQGGEQECERFIALLARLVRRAVAYDATKAGD